MITTESPGPGLNPTGTVTESETLCTALSAGTSSYTGKFQAHALVLSRDSVTWARDTGPRPPGRRGRRGSASGSRYPGPH